MRHAYHEQRPWIEPPRTSRILGHLIIGTLITLALFIVLAVMEIRMAVIIIAGLAVFIFIVLANWTTSQHNR